jgi:hypothetical protein
MNSSRVLCCIFVALVGASEDYDFPFQVYSLKSFKKSGLSMLVPMGLDLKSGSFVDIQHFVGIWRIKKVKTKVSNPNHQGTGPAPKNLQEITLTTADGCPHGLGLAAIQDEGHWRRSIGKYTVHRKSKLQPIVGADGSIYKLPKSGRLMTLQRAQEYCTSEPKCDAIMHDNGRLAAKAKGKFTFYSINTTRHHDQDDHIVGGQQPSMCLWMKERSVYHETEKQCSVAGIDELDHCYDAAEDHYVKYLLCLLGMHKKVPQATVDQWRGSKATNWLNKLKKTYRKLSIKMHPDKHMNQGKLAREAAEARYKKIAEAHQIVTDIINGAQSEYQMQPKRDQHVRNLERYRRLKAAMDFYPAHREFASELRYQLA